MLNCYWRTNTFWYLHGKIQSESIVLFTLLKKCYKCCAITIVLHNFTESNFFFGGKTTALSLSKNNTSSYQLLLTMSFTYLNIEIKLLTGVDLIPVNFPERQPV